MLTERLSSVPQNPGVYLFKGKKEKILYVGKAKNLRKRLSSYFGSRDRLDPRKISMMELVQDFSYIVTGNELEAFVLEANLIKQHKPRFNIVLRDDKNYPYLRLTVQEDWPRIDVVRRAARDGALYFGPYVPAHGMWETLAFIRRNFLIRTCRHLLDKPVRPCIQHQMGRCGAPCAGAQTKEEYRRIVEEVVHFLKGEKAELLQALQTRMLTLSEELNFEEAARIRDRIQSIQRAWESQRAVSPDLGDLDVVGCASEGPDAAVSVLFIRNGVMIGSKDFFLAEAGMTDKAEVVRAFMEMFYMKELAVPREVVLCSRISDATTLRSWLKEKRGSPVSLSVPRDEQRRDLISMANENARQHLIGRKPAGTSDILEDLKRRLSLPLLPGSIGAFDISTISGSESVGAYVSWADGGFVKAEYRRMRIKTVAGVDDYAMMEEVITRTLMNLKERTPSLIVIDGGKGQLEIARRVLEQHDFRQEDGTRPALISVAKDPDRAFTLSSDVIDLEDRTRSSLLLRKIRDEVHRFAVGYHRKLRDERLTASELEQVHGIGKRRRLLLLRHFGSIDALRNATIEEIGQVSGLNKAVAKNLYHALRRP